jgi:hypothetical protein
MTRTYCKGVLELILTGLAELVSKNHTGTAESVLKNSEEVGKTMEVNPVLIS